MNATVPCAHCGLPAPPARPGPSFCCSGCAAVYEVLAETGLSGYYSIRERIDPVPPGTARPSRPPGGDASRWLHLDTADNAEANDDGYCELRVTGLHCAACAWVLERLPAVVEGVEETRVDLASEKMHVRWDPTRVRLSDIAAFVATLGYALHAVDRDADATDRSQRRAELLRIGVTGAAAGNVMLYSLALYFGAFSGMDPGWVDYFTGAAALVATVSVTYGALPFYRGALAGLRVGRLHMDLPIAVGVLGGYGASLFSPVYRTGEVYYDSVTALVFLLLIGRQLQRRSQRWALSHTHLLSLLVPPMATRVVGDSLEAIASARVRPGDRLFVEPGEVFPADGRIFSGTSRVDTSSLTGESAPRSVEVGSEVLAGTKNVGDAVEVEALATGPDSRIGGLARRIMQADAERAPLQQSVERITGIFVALVLGLAVVGGLAWLVVEPSRVFEVVVSLLVISCPCALGLATPMALSVARARAAKHGILLSSTKAIEDLARVKTVVFDKTGTLTEGTLAVANVEWHLGDDDDDDARTRWMEVVAALESDSGHPVGQSLRRWATSAPPGDGSAQALDGAVRVVPGRGVEATTRGHHVRLGAPSFVGVSAEVESARTPVVFSVEGRALATFSLADRIRSEAPAVVQHLRDLGLSLAIYSGDHGKTVASVADALGIAHARGGMTPEGKADALQADARSGAVLMIGDGVNDAAAFRAATVGMATAGGAEVSTRVADVHLRRPGLRGVVVAIDGSRRALSVVRRNLAFSLAYNSVFASLALAGWVSPLAAAVLMPASSLTVIASSVFWRFGSSTDDLNLTSQRQTLPATHLGTVATGE